MDDKKRVFGKGNLGSDMDLSDIEWDDYERKAIKFLLESDAKMEIAFVRYEKNPLWSDEEERAKYKVRLITPQGKAVVIFWDSLCDTRNLKSTGLAKYMPTPYDVLSCLESYDPMEFKDFIADTGMRENDEHAYKVYAACRKQHKDLSRIFTEAQMMKLQEIR